MNSIETLREELHQAIIKGNMDEILKISQQLDALIVAYMESKRKSRSA